MRYMRVLNLKTLKLLRYHIHTYLVFDNAVDAQCVRDEQHVLVLKMDHWVGVTGRVRVGGGIIVVRSMAMSF